MWNKRNVHTLLLGTQSSRATWGSLTVSYKAKHRLAFLVAQTVKIPPAVKETWVPSLGQEDPLEEGMATRSSILAWRIPWTEEPGGPQSIGLQRVGHDWVTKHRQPRIGLPYCPVFMVQLFAQMSWKLNPYIKNWNTHVNDSFIFILVINFGCIGSSLLCRLFCSCGVQAVQCGFSACGTRASHRMWDLPRPGIELVTPALEDRFLTTGPAGKSSSFNCPNLDIAKKDVLQSVTR